MRYLDEILTKASTRLIEFKHQNSNDEISIHILAFEIAICLTELSIKTNPSRPISKDEEQWFRAGFYIDQVLVNSEWEDMIELYYKVVELVKERNYFR